MIWAHLRNLLLTSVIVIVFIKVEQQKMVKFQVFFVSLQQKRFSTPALERVGVSPRLIWTGYRGSESGHNVPVRKTLTAVSAQDSMIL